MMKIEGERWHIDNNRPVFIQIMEIINNHIASGFYQPGDKLPSVREIAAIAAVNPNTVQKALGELERTGLIHSKRTTGRFVTEDESQIQALKEDQVNLLIETFYQGMEKLGYSRQEAVELVRVKKEEGQDER